jgi:hypothetical protein
MAAGQPAILFDYSSSDPDSTTESSSSEDGEYPHSPERILAEHIDIKNKTWFLVKWKDCPVIRSSWERPSLFLRIKRVAIINEWLLEKQRQSQGLSTPFDLTTFDSLVLKAEALERGRRRLRRLKNRIEKNIEICNSL